MHNCVQAGRRLFLSTWRALRTQIYHLAVILFVKVGIRFSDVRPIYSLLRIRKAVSLYTLFVGFRALHSSFIIFRPYPPRRQMRTI